ncbi:MAG TPA: hypothetical protein VE996_07245 [Terriglobales bacterium]|nr:hypothetical protein [Terriglobales bacterium]
MAIVATVLLAGRLSATRPRPLTDQEIRRSIANALRAAGVPGALAALHSQRLSAPVTVTVAQPRLRVVAIRPDPLEGVTRFQMVAEAEPHLLPFEVSLAELIHFPGGVPAWYSSRPGKGLPFANENRRVPLHTDWLVCPSHPAILTILAARFRVNLSVRPLELGARGQTIRVRDVAGKRVLRAAVIGPDQLEIRE